MPKIVSVTYRGKGVEVSLDTGESLFLPLDAVDGLSLNEGAAIEQDAYLMIKEESRKFQCERTALDYLAIRPRSVAEMERYLARKGFDADMVRDAVRKLEEAGYLNDQEFASRFVASKLQRKLVGKRLLKAELMRRGVHRSAIKKALEEASSRLTSIDEVYEIAAKKYALLSGAKNRLQKLVTFLRSRGFDGETIALVIERIRLHERE